jgi:hypothetical protein
MGREPRQRKLGPEQRIVLVGGAMRSGTTIIHRALCTAKNSNPYLSECWYLRDLLHLRRIALVRYDLRYRDQLGALANYEHIVKMQAEYYFALVSARYGDPGVLFLKHPELVKYFVEMGRMFPNMLFIAIVRDPRDVIASMKQIRERQLAEDLFSPLIKLGDHIEALCEFYAEYYDRLLKFAPGLKPRVSFVRYEDVMNDPKTEVAKIGKFAGADFDLEQVGTFEKADVDNYLDKEARLSDPVSTTFWSDLYTKDFSKERIGTFGEVLDKKEVAEIETRLATIGKRFNYW